MTLYLRFLCIGLILGLHTEVQLKLVAGINPPAFVIAVLAYPVLLSLAYLVGRVLDRLIPSVVIADLLHYLAVGIGGLAFEWLLLGNGPASNAFQSGMFAMWTTFCFGPRILSRETPVIVRSRRKFWTSFGLLAVLQAVVVLLATGPKVKLVLAVVGLSGAYILWSCWLLLLAWRSRRQVAPRPLAQS